EFQIVDALVMLEVVAKELHRGLPAKQLLQWSVLTLAHEASPRSRRSIACDQCVLASALVPIGVQLRCRIPSKPSCRTPAGQASAHDLQRQRLGLSPARGASRTVRRREQPSTSREFAPLPRIVLRLWHPEFVERLL